MERSINTHTHILSNTLQQKRIYFSVGKSLGTRKSLQYNLTTFDYLISNLEYVLAHSVSKLVPLRYDVVSLRSNYYHRIYSLSSYGDRIALVRRPHFIATFQHL